MKGEDGEQYARILDQVTRSVSPTDIIEEFWVRDVTDLLWEVLRLRRLKGSLLQAATRQGLITVLEPLADYIKARLLADGWFCGDQQAKQETDELLNEAGLSFDVVLAEGLAAKLSDIERIDRMIAGAEARRNAVVREISRHRDAVAARLARASETIEEAEFAEVSSNNHHAAGPHDQQP
ncbi:hypothetical protein CRT23_24575 [Methylobacterium sp. V23]|nr:hypothetical protein CRT23_24575 [Methylobacterium sp. V23]